MATDSIFSKIYRSFTYFGILYAIGILLLAIPTVQRYVLYQHIFRWPFFTDFTVPESSGLAPHKTLNVYLPTPDNITLGAWFILSDNYYQKNFLPNRPQTTFPPITLEVASDAIQARPTILYLHGTAGNRATPSRVHHYAGWTSRLQANVLAIDYRGFGDSTGQPNEPGVELDAYTAFQWLVENGAKPEDILIVGHSLGTGIASKLAKRLTKEGIKPRGLTLLAPFTSLTVVIESYPLFGLPILQPLQSFPAGRKFMKWLTREEFDTLSIIQEIDLPVFVAHSTSDFEIPHVHSRNLIEQLLNPILPPSITLANAPGSSITKEEFEAYKAALSKRKEARALLVKKTEIERLGLIEEFEVRGHKVTYVESHWGGHNLVGLQEGVQDEMARMFQLNAY